MGGGRGGAVGQQRGSRLESSDRRATARRTPLLNPSYLFVLFAALECGDRVLVQVGGDVDTLCDFGRRGRSLEDAVVLLSVGRFLTGRSR